MNQVMYVLSDSILFWLMEAVIFIIFILTICKDKCAKRKIGGTRATVIRGEKSSSRLFISWGMLIIVVGITNSTNITVNYKVLASILNIAFISYLCFFSSYFRNKIIGWASRIEKFEEN